MADREDALSKQVDIGKKSLKTLNNLYKDAKGFFSNISQILVPLGVGRIGSTLNNLQKDTLAIGRTMPDLKKSIEEMNKDLPAGLSMAMRKEAEALGVGFKEVSKGQANLLVVYESLDLNTAALNTTLLSTKVAMGLSTKSIDDLTSQTIRINKARNVKFDQLIGALTDLTGVMMQARSFGVMGTNLPSVAQEMVGILGPAYRPVIQTFFEELTRKDLDVIAGLNRFGMMPLRVSLEANTLTAQETLRALERLSVEANNIVTSFAPGMRGIAVGLQEQALGGTKFLQLAPIFGDALREAQQQGPLNQIVKSIDDQNASIDQYLQTLDILSERIQDPMNRLLISGFGPVVDKLNTANEKFSLMLVLLGTIAGAKLFSNPMGLIGGAVAGGLTGLYFKEDIMAMLKTGVDKTSYTNKLLEYVADNTEKAAEDKPEPNLNATRLQSDLVLKLLQQVILGNTRLESEKAQKEVNQHLMNTAEVMQKLVDATEENTIVTKESTELSGPIKPNPGPGGRNGVP